MTDIEKTLDSVLELIENDEVSLRSLSIVMLITLLITRSSYGKNLLRSMLKSIPDNQREKFEDIISTILEEESKHDRRRRRA